MSESTGNARRKARLAGAVGLLAAGAVTGGVLAATLSASAADSPAATPQNTATGVVPPPRGDGDGHRGAMGGATPVRPDEKALSGNDAAKVRAAALKAVPGGTVYRVETDAGDGVYEAHMTKSDGTAVTVKLDKDFNVTKVEDGMGLGDPAPPGAPGNPPTAGTTAPSA
jgi:hypothetical protein